MSETLYYERGRQILSWREVLNNHAKLVHQPGFLPDRRWYEFRRWFKPDEPLVLRSFDGPAIEFAGLRLPMDETRCHGLVLGATGSGKSILLSLASVGMVEEVKRNPDARALFYDRKGELLPQLAGMGIEPVLIDPFDERGVRIDFARDIRSPADCEQMAAAFVPKASDGQDPFWSRSTRAVFAAVVQSLMQSKPGQWTLADVLRAMSSAEEIEKCVGRYPETAIVWKNVRGEAKTEANLLASFMSFLKRFQVVAALWERPGPSISLRDWSRSGNQVLVLRSHPNHSEVLAPIHRLILDLVADETLSLPDSNTRRTFMVLDEFRTLGRVESAMMMANEGRSKGTCLFIGSQSVEGLQEVYGEKGASELLGQIRSKVFLRNDSSATARWVEEHIGQVQFWVESVSRQSSYGDGKSTSGVTRSYSRRRESAILASEIMKLPPPMPGGSLTLINDVPGIGGVFVTKYDFDEMVSRLPKPRPGFAPFVPRPVADQFFKLEPETASPTSPTGKPTRRRRQPTKPQAHPTDPNVMIDELLRLDREEDASNEKPQP
jgi:type IV secretory pathway TraG/TraD family ATPase VirD4